MTCFLKYWCSSREIHWSLVDAPHKGPMIHIFDDFFVIGLNALLNIQWGCHWFEMLWGYCDITISCPIHEQNQYLQGPHQGEFVMNISNAGNLVVYEKQIKIIT